MWIQLSAVLSLSNVILKSKVTSSWSWLLCEVVCLLKYGLYGQGCSLQVWGVVLMWIFFQEVDIFIEALKKACEKFSYLGLQYVIMFLNPFHIIVPPFLIYTVLFLTHADHLPLSSPSLSDSIRWKMTSIQPGNNYNYGGVVIIVLNAIVFVSNVGSTMATLKNSTLDQREPLDSPSDIIILWIGMIIVSCCCFWFAPLASLRSHVYWRATITAWTLLRS